MIGTNTPALAQPLLLASPQNTQVFFKQQAHQQPGAKLAQSGIIRRLFLLEGPFWRPCAQKFAQTSKRRKQRTLQLPTGFLSYLIGGAWEVVYYPTHVLCTIIVGWRLLAIACTVCLDSSSSIFFLNLLDGLHQQCCIHLQPIRLGGGLYSAQTSEPGLAS